MTLEIKILVWDKHKIVAGLYGFIECLDNTYIMFSICILGTHVLEKLENIGKMQINTVSVLMCLAV